MPTNTAGSQARAYHQAQTHYIDLTYTFASLPGTSTLPIGTVPAGAAIKGVFSAIITPFNAGTTNTFSIGTTSGGTNLVTTANGSNGGSSGLVVHTMTLGSAQVLQVDTTFFLTSTSTGTASTAGAATVYIEYLVPDSVLV